MRGGAAARSITASSWTMRCGPFGPSASRDWISPLRYQDRRAERVVQPGTEERSAHIPFTPRTKKKTLELALREALQLHHTYIGTEHILLALVRKVRASARTCLPSGSIRSARFVPAHLPPRTPCPPSARWPVAHRSAAIPTRGWQAP